MKAKRFQIQMMLFVVAVLSIGLLVLNGCKKSETESPKPAKQMQSQEGQEHADMKAEPAAETASTTEQKICPVMGNPIDKDVYVEYKGKKVYFCCPDCKAKFNADPEKYVAKLPQFKQ